MIKIAVCDDDRIDGEIIGRLLDQYTLDHDQKILLKIFESGEQFLASKYIPDIYYFEYYDRKVKIVTKDNIYVCKEKIGSIAERMMKYGFAMSHQSFVVNLYCVHEIKKQALVMKNGDEVFLAQKRASMIRKMLMQAARKSG